MTFPAKGGAWTLTPDRLAAYVRAFPALDVPQELTSARLWLVDHPRRHKTPAGMALPDGLATAQRSPAVHRGGPAAHLCRVALPAPGGRRHPGPREPLGVRPP